MAMALLEIPVSGCTCFSTACDNKWAVDEVASRGQTFVDVRGVSLLSRLLTLLLLPISRRLRCFLRSLLALSSLSGCFGSGGGSWGLATSRSGFRSHLKGMGGRVTGERQ